LLKSGCATRSPG